MQAGNFLSAQIADSTVTSNLIDSVATDSTKKKKKIKKIRKPRVPWKAALMSGLVPGLGQIYNRKYWKLPIVWGAIGVTGYFIVDQHLLYIDYRDAYRELVNNNNVLPGFEAYANNSTGLKSQRDTYERTRNILSIVAAALWTLNIIDATVDAHLSTFDVSDDLTFNFQPNTFTSPYNRQPVVGISLYLSFK